MMSHCMVRGCRSGSGRTDISVTFHPFPAEREAAERWASLCGVSGHKCSELLKDLEHGSHESYHLCSLHFEQEAFETNSDDKTRNVNLRHGAEPTLLLSPLQPPKNNAQVNTSVPSACSAQREARPAASARPSCSCARPNARTSHTVQSADRGASADVRCSAPHGPHVSHCSTGTTVVSPQPGVSQIVLNFREGAKRLALDNVSTESAPQCRGGSHCQQSVVKQVVLILLDRPHESAACSSSSQESALTISASTQTEGRSTPSAPVHTERPVHVSTQTTTSTGESPEPMEGVPTTSEDSRSPREQICPSSDRAPYIPDTPTVPPCPERSTQDGVSGAQADMDYLPPVLNELQGAPESLAQEDGSNVDSQAQIADDQAPKHLRKCELRPETPSQPPVSPHSQPNCRPFCIDPSINQCVGDLLEQCTVPLPPCVSAASSSSRCPCISAQHRVKQIVVNFVEPDIAAGNEDVPAPCTSRDLSPPVVTSQQHQETQTQDWFLLPQRAKENPKSPSPRPPKSRSCPPVLNPCTAPICQEGESGPVDPQDIGVCLENKVTFEDVAIYFSKEEWELLGDADKSMYRAVMSDNCQFLISLGLLQEKPDLVLQIENHEENLWVNLGSPRRICLYEEDPPCVLDLDMDGVCTSAKDNGDTSPCTGRESAESSSHLGALMRLVNEIPGFLLGSSVTDGSSSPACSTEGPGSSRPLLEVKTEDRTPACSPASSHAPVSETTEVIPCLGTHKRMEQTNGKIVTKAEKTEVAVSQSSRYSMPVTHLSMSPTCIKSDPCASTGDRLRIKQEEFPTACSPAHPVTGPQKQIFPVKPNVSHFPKIPLYSPVPRDCLIPDHVRRPGSGGGSSLSRSTAASPRNPSVSPNHGANCTGLGELKIKIKQEDSGSDRDLSESSVYGRKVHHPPGFSTEREHWHVAASPLRSPSDTPLGSSPLHRLVNCLKEISAVRPRLYNSTWSASRWGAEASASSPRDLPIPAPPPNPFTVAVTNGAAQLRGVEPRTSDGQNTGAGRNEPHMGPVPLSTLGKCLEKIHSRMSSGGSHSSEESRRAGLGVKRTHSDDPSKTAELQGGVKRPALEVSGPSRVVSGCSSHRDLWRPPEELPRTPSEDQPVGNSHLMSVMNCVLKVPRRRLSPSIHVTSPADSGRSSAQGIVTEVKVKQEKGKNHPSETSRQWILPPQSPDVPKQSGSLATNVHLTGLMRLMEEIPCAEASNPSRAMYSIAVGHSLVRRMDRSNRLSSSNDDCGFQEELNDGTIASVDSVYSDDTSWSSENVDPSYSAIGGLQRVVSEFAELGSVSPLVAVAAPPVSSVQEGIALKKPKDASTASTSRLNENVRRLPREAVGIAHSACSTENGEASIAAIRGLQKVVHGFVEQECVSPITAVRITTPTANLGPRDDSGKRSGPEEEAPSPHLQGSSPAPISHYLCDSVKWLSEPDSSYSALSGLQKVVNGFSEMSCISPFSAVSTPVSDSTVEVSIQRQSDAPGLDLVSSTLTGQKNVINGAPDANYLSPLRVASVSSESDAGLSIKSRDEGSQKCLTEKQKPTAMTVPSHNDSEQSHSSSSTPAATSNQCIDLTQEEEVVCSKIRSAAPERRQKNREARHSELPSNRPENLVGNRTRLPGSNRTSCNQLIDLTVEDETQTKPKISSSEVTRKSRHAGMRLHPPLAEKHRHAVKLSKIPCGKLDKPLDPGASGSDRGAVPAVNEHLSGLEKLLNGVPTFPPASRPSGQALGGSWWFKSTSSPET